MCLQISLAKTRDEINSLHYRANKWNRQGRNKHNSGWTTDGQIIDRIFYLQEKEQSILAEIEYQKSIGNTEAIYGF